MALFNDFSFAAPSQFSPTASDPTSYWNISPTTTPPPSPGYSNTAGHDRHSSMAELTHKFHCQTLGGGPSSSRRAYHDLPTPPNEPDELSRFDPWAIPSLDDLQSFDTYTTASIRSQRQANVRWQCSESHAKDIASLIEDMISTREQCILTPRTSQSTSTVPSSPTSDEESRPACRRMSTSTLPLRQGLKYKRSGENLKGACVARDVRVRKRGSGARKSGSRS